MLIEANVDYTYERLCQRLHIARAIAKKYELKNILHMIDAISLDISNWNELSFSEEEKAIDAYENMTELVTFVIEYMRRSTNNIEIRDLIEPFAEKELLTA